MGSLAITPPPHYIKAWGIDQLLQRYPRLRSVAKHAKEVIAFEGKLDIYAVKPGHTEVTDSFELRIEIPYQFPDYVPTVYPLGSRLPADFHRLEDGALCLGSPTRQLMYLSKNPSVLGFVNEFVVPYLYGYSLLEKGEQLPFGELAHGRRGLIADFCDIFGVSEERVARELVYLTSRPKRKANHRLCPCGSGVRLSRCKVHHAMVHQLRCSLGRRWFRYQHKLITGGTRKSV
ncbi:MAG: hypothetical protein KDB03_05050 [Planctomycetales bacterium]|nr:hypothetical protein [Planctomycetales bacterium]